MSAILGGLGAVAEPLGVPPLLIRGRRAVVGWPSGSSIDSQETLAFSALSGVLAKTEVFPLEGAAEPYDHMISGGGRFRAVLLTGPPRS